MYLNTRQVWGRHHWPNQSVICQTQNLNNSFPHLLTVVIGLQIEHPWTTCRPTCTVPKKWEVALSSSVHPLCMKINCEEATTWISDCLHSLWEFHFSQGYPFTSKQRRLQYVWHYTVYYILCTVYYILCFSSFKITNQINQTYVRECSG